MVEKATFAAGCFWHVEEVFYKTKGVVKTEVGFMGGDEKKFPKPSYKEVSSGKTGYAESVNLEFNPKQISYEKLLEIFFTNQDSTQFHRQGPDVGSQYRSIIFYRNEKQKKLAESAKAKFQKKSKKKIVTEIVKAGKFIKAEDYHQKYFKKHPVVCKIMNIFGK